MPLIRDLPNFKWPAPIQTNPSQRNPSMRCNYHRDHGHETNKFRSLKFLVERLIKIGHLRRYIKEVDREEESPPTSGRVTTDMIVAQAKACHKLYTGRTARRSVPIKTLTKEAPKSNHDQSSGERSPHER